MSLVPLIPYHSQIFGTGGIADGNLYGISFSLVTFLAALGNHFAESQRPMIL